MPNGDLSEMKAGQSRRESPVAAAGMLYGQRDLAEAMRELGFTPAAPATGLVKYLPTINVVLGVLLAASIAGAGYVYRASSTQMDQSTQDIRDLRAQIVQIKEDRASRIALGDARFAELDRSVRRFELVQDAVTRQGKTIEALGEKLSTGRDDRVRDINSLTEAQTGIRLELNGVKVELGFIRRALEARGRGPDGPFGENQAYPWSGRLPPYGLRASLDATSVGGEP